jgi:hypothetical protein
VNRSASKEQLNLNIDEIILLFIERVKFNVDREFVLFSCKFYT